jgi:hypothetical protein
MTRYLLPALLFCASAHASEPVMADNWGGRNAHLGFSAGIGGVAGLQGLRPTTGLGLCMAVGVAKEIGDYHKPSPGYKHGLFSRRDLVSDAVGCGLGYFVGRGLHLAITPGGVTVGYAVRW